MVSVPSVTDRPFFPVLKWLGWIEQTVSQPPVLESLPCTCICTCTDCISTSSLGVTTLYLYCTCTDCISTSSLRHYLVLGLHGRHTPLRPLGLLESILSLLVFQCLLQLVEKFIRTNILLTVIICIKVCGLTW